MSETSFDTDELTAPARLVEPYLQQHLERCGLPRNLVDAIEYSLLGGGKRLRPILVIRSCEALGGEAERALPPAAAIELIHCFSLVHDDLPAMDDDDMRRGRPTLHKHTNEAMAILAGDTMMGLAFQLLSEKVRPPKLATSLISELSGGTNLMIAGQVEDTIPDYGDARDEAHRLDSIHRHKTGALLRAAVRMGAMVGGAKRKQLEAMTAFGEAIGLMFQIVDDVLDVTQPSDHLGKTAGKDAEQQKLTYPALYGLEESRRRVEQLRSEAHRALEPFGPNAEQLRKLCEYLAVRTR